MDLESIAEKPVPSDTISAPNVDTPGTADEFDLPQTGEREVDAALALVPDLASAAPAEAAAAFGEVLQRLEGILKDSQETHST